MRNINENTKWILKFECIQYLKKKYVYNTYKKKKIVLNPHSLNNDFIWVMNVVTHLESLADSWIQHEPVHPAIHPDSANEQLLLFDLLVARVQQMVHTRIRIVFNYS